VPREKIRRIEDNCGTDVDRMSARPGIPLISCSSGTVTKDSTSDVDRPRLSVWIWIWGGAKSGKTSTELLGTVAMQTASIVAAAAITRYG
jgi:hypothetical protein